MKILLVHNFYQQPGGEDTVFTAELNLLRKFGHHPIIFTEKNVDLGSFGRLKLAVNTIWSKSTQRKLHSIIRDTSPDLVHFHNTFNCISPSAYYTCKDAGLPIVQTLHNYRLLCPKAILMRDTYICERCINKTFPWPAIKYSCYRGSRAATTVVSTMLVLHRWLKTYQKKVDAFIALTEFSRQKFITAGLPGQKIFVKPNFVSINSNKAHQHHTHALYVGRLSSEKGIETLLQAWKHLEHIPLTIIGDGPLAKKLHNGELDIKSSKINWLGWLSAQNVLEVMLEMRLLIFPSECYETFGITIIEAFACGLPVIASRLGAIAEIVHDGQTGLLFRPGDPYDLADKVRWAWSHPAKMLNMAKAARKEYEEKYTEEKNLGLLIEIYRKAIEINKSYSNKN